MAAAGLSPPLPSSATLPAVPPGSVYRLRHQLFAPQALPGLQTLLQTVSSVWEALSELQTAADQQERTRHTLTSLLFNAQAAFSVDSDAAVLPQLQRVTRLLLLCDSQSAAAFDSARDDIVRLLNLASAGWEDEQRQQLMADVDDRQQLQPSALLAITQQYVQSLHRASSHLIAANRALSQRTDHHEAMLQLIAFCPRESREEAELSSAAALSSVCYACMAWPSLSSSDAHLLLRCQLLSRVSDADDDELLLQLQSRSACRLLLQSLLVTICYGEDEQTEVRCYSLHTLSLAPLTDAAVANGELQSGAASASHVSVSVERSQLLPRVSLLLSSKPERRGFDGERIAPQLTVTCRYRTAAALQADSSPHNELLSSELGTNVFVVGQLAHQPSSTVAPAADAHLCCVV